MLFMSKHNNAPNSDCLSCFLMRVNRSLRSRSKLTRSSQSTPIRPYVLIAITLLLRVRHEPTCPPDRVTCPPVECRFIEHVVPTYPHHPRPYRPHNVLANSTTDAAVGTVRSSSTGEKGTGTSIAPIRLTGASR